MKLVKHSQATPVNGYPSNQENLAVWKSAFLTVQSESYYIIFLILFPNYLYNENLHNEGFALLQTSLFWKIISILNDQ